jgi:hypothetical protein
MNGSGSQYFDIIIKARLRLDEGELDLSDNDAVVEVVAAVNDALENSDIEIDAYDEDEQASNFVLLIDNVEFVGKPEEPAAF